MSFGQSSTEKPDLVLFYWLPDDHTRYISFVTICLAVLHVLHTKSLLKKDLN